VLPIAGLSPVYGESGEIFEHGGAATAAADRAK